LHPQQLAVPFLLDGLEVSTSGSIGIAMYPDDGADFDELLNDKARVNLVKVYWQKVEYPRLQVTADDMRAYYQHHLNDIFTQRSQAQFRVIKIDFKRTGGREQALAKHKH
jgi:predicted signal transduction protein with EAL and GGDEF domain